MRYLFTLFFVCSITFGATLNVPADYSLIQDAIDASGWGDTVLVASGTYVENISFFHDPVVLISEEGPFQTCIDGSSQNASVVVFDRQTPETVMRGFRLINGSGTPYYIYPYLHHFGGGIYNSIASSPEISHCIIENNTASNMGAGIFSGESSSPYIHHCLISNNKIHNTSFPAGAGVCFMYSACPVLSYCVISNNTTNSYPGEGGVTGVYNIGSYSSLTMINCVVADNVGEGDISGLYSSGPVQILNCIFWGNSNAQLGGPSLTVQYSDIEGAFPGLGNIDSDPFFTSGLLGDYQLNPVFSPCIDSGHPGPAYNDPEDPLNPGFALWPALGSLRNDMGVYGGPLCGEYIDPSTGIEEYTSLVQAGGEIRISPNPVHTGYISVGLFLGSYTEVNISLFDNAGRKIRTSNVSCGFTAGDHVLSIDVTELPTGLYFCLVTLDEFSSGQVLAIIN